MPTILQITDTHLRGSDEPIKGVAPLENLKRVLEAARDYCPNPALVVWTGDIADDESEGAYDKMREAVGDWYERSRWIPGNHDNRALMRAHLLNESTDDSSLLCFSEGVEGWHLLGLDTLVPGQTPGELRFSQWQSLHHSVNGEPILIFSHHPLALVHCNWMDDMGIQNREVFDAMLLETSAICANFAGHVHSEYDGDWNGVRICTTPSTLFQFKREPDTILIHPVPPGFRAIHLDGPTMHTEVIRLAESNYAIPTG
ncbi:MAG: metallophosphoesterase [Planctomycetota bacterium]|nr:metallophosphoesterase [Planctomycetota bacterium]